MPDLVAKWMGVDVTTTEMALAVSDGQDTEGFASIKMRGAAYWNGDPAFPAFDLSLAAGMFLELLGTLRDQGWQFEPPGSLSIACRQHDLAVLGENGALLMPALSWQCNAAADETIELNLQPGVRDTVGRVEERFILPKLALVLKKDPAIRERIKAVMTTGDWMMGILAGTFRLSTSDALSNGLLVQESRRLAKDALELAGINKDWFPKVIQSGHRIGQVRASGTRPDKTWKEVARTLNGWQVVAGLGDNHASGLGCGMRDEKTLVVSAGTSGTINLACPADASLEAVDEPALRFEFYRERSLLLRMLAYCGDWYNRFLDEFGGEFGDSHCFLNDQARRADLAKTWRVDCDRKGEFYRPGWSRLSLGRKVASIQFSIALELLIHVKKMLAEVPNARQQLTTYVLTGGLSQSVFFQQVFRAGIEILDRGKDVKVSGRTGPLRYKTSAYGALLNARMPEWQHDLDNIPDSLFPLVDCAQVEEEGSRRLNKLLEKELAP